MAFLFLPYVEPPLAIHPPDPLVNEAAEAAARAIADVVAGFPVEHVGSTAVPGLPGKNSINLLIPADQAEFQGILQMLEALGLAEHPYKEEPADRPVRVGLYQHGDGKHAIHVKVVKSGSKDHYGSLYMREYLRAHPQAVKAYAALKRELLAAGAGPDEYGAGKQPFVVDIVAKRPEGWTGPADPLS